MEWSLIDYECLIDKDDYSIIIFNINDITNNENNKKYLENINTFLDDLRKSYTNQSLKRQFKVDFPREIFYINNVKINDIITFINEISYTNYVKEVLMISTQSSVFPVTLKLFEIYKNEKDDIHVSDFINDNPLIFKFKIYNKYHLRVNIEKKFKIIKIINGDPYTLRLLQVNTEIEMDNTNKDIYYSIKEIK